MKRSKWIGATLAMVLMGSGLAISQEATTRPTAKEAKPARAEAEKPKGRLVKPWSDLKSLTDEQKARIIEIHQAANEAKKEIDRKEKEDIMAVLGEAQKAELSEMLATEAAARKARQAEKKEEQKEVARPEGEKPANPGM